MILDRYANHMIITQIMPQIDSNPIHVIRLEIIIDAFHFLSYVSNYDIPGRNASLDLPPTKRTDAYANRGRINRANN
jgi:hypothetical protein